MQEYFKAKDDLKRSFQHIGAQHGDLDLRSTGLSLEITKVVEAKFQKWRKKFFFLTIPDALPLKISAEKFGYAFYASALDFIAERQAKTLLRNTIFTLFKANITVGYISNQLRDPHTIAKVGKWYREYYET